MHLVCIFASLVLFTTANALSIQPFSWKCQPACMIVCPYGLEVDSRGCTQCTCRQFPPNYPGLCKAPICMMLRCEYGQMTDSRGCPICQCRENPINCPYRRRCGPGCPTGRYATDPFGCQTCDCLI